MDSNIAHIDKQFFAPDKQCQAYNEFYKKVVMPRIADLSRCGCNKKFAIGVNSFDDSPLGLSYSISTACKYLDIYCCLIDASQLHGREQLKDYYATLLSSEYSVIIVDYVDEIPNGNEKQSIENLILNPWQTGKLIQRENFLIIFISHLYHGGSLPPILKNLKRMEWLGNVMEFERKLNNGGGRKSEEE